MLFAHAVFNIFTGVLDVTNNFCGTNNVCVVPYGVMRNLDAIIRVRMVLCETSMLLFVSVWCYGYYVSNYVRLNPGLQRARSLWSGASEN